MVLVLCWSFTAGRPSLVAELIAEALPQFAPQTNLYRLDSGQHILVTRIVGELPLPPVLAGAMSGVPIGVTEPIPTEVFLCDENARLIDADGDPTNGMTALLRLAGGTTFDDAVRVAEQHLDR